MSAKEFLSRARKLQERINQLEEARSLVRPGSSSRLSTMIGRELDRLDELRTEILEVVNQVPDNTLAALLISYYVNGKTWEETAESMHFSYEHVARELHPKALAEVGQILKRCHKIS